MHWTPPKIKTTPRMRAAYRLLNFIEKRCTVKARNGKENFVTHRTQAEVDKLARIISEEQRALRLLERCAEPLCSEMGNSIATNATKILPFLCHDETSPP